MFRFFWKDKVFEKHARENGLAGMPQVGVVLLKHSGGGFVLLND